MPVHCVGAEFYICKQSFFRCEAVYLMAQFFLFSSMQQQAAVHLTDCTCGTCVCVC